MISDHINVKLTGTHLDAFKAFATRFVERGRSERQGRYQAATPDVILALIETLPEFEALTGIKSEYGKNPQPRPMDESGGE